MQVQVFTPIAIASSIMQGGNIIPEQSPAPPPWASFLLLTTLFSMVAMQAEPILRVWGDFLALCRVYLDTVQKPAVGGISRILAHMPGWLELRLRFEHLWRELMERLSAPRQAEQRDVELEAVRSDE